MHRLPWAIVIAAALLAMGLAADNFVYAIVQGAVLRLVQFPTFWTWLIALAFAVLSLVRLWSEPAAPSGSHRGFQVLPGPAAGKGERN
jgi:hypothetical protein